MIEFEVGGVLYRAGKLDAFKQFHVARRLAPVLGGLAGLLDSAGTPPDPSPEGGQEGETPAQAAKPPADALAALGPLAEAVANMPDDHADFILKECLLVVSRQLEGGTGWAPIMVRSTGKPLGEMDMATMLQLVFHVIRDNLAGFFAALPPMSAGGLAGALVPGSSS